MRLPLPILVALWFLLEGCTDPNAPTADSHATACAKRGDFALKSHGSVCNAATEAALLAIIQTDPDCRATFPDASSVTCTPIDAGGDQ